MKEIININNGWQFIKEGVSTKVNLPHSYNAIDGQNQADYYRGECEYIRELPELKGRSFVEINGANSVANVYINDVHLGEHRGGYSMFRFEITSYLNSEKNILKIVVDNSDFADIYPSKADFTFYGGLYRDVNIITNVGDCFFDLTDLTYHGVKVNTVSNAKEKLGVVKLHSNVVGNADNMKIQLIDDKNNIAVELNSSDYIYNELAIPDVHLWNGMSDPYLYTLKCQLIKNDKVVDETSLKVGFREIAFDCNEGCYLNGKYIKLKGVSRHQDRENIGNALTYDEHKQDLMLIKEVGANSIRLAHYQQNQIVYDLADEMGFLVWAEVPVITVYSKQKQANAQMQLTELIMQNINHACIFCWGIQNEVTVNTKAEGMEEGINALNKLAKTLDPYRPTTSAQVMMNAIKSPYNEITDILGYNIYYGWYVEQVKAIDNWLDSFHATNPTIKLCLSEYGAEAILKYQTDKGIQGDYTEDYQAKMHYHYAKAIAERKWLWGSYVWNMFDFGAANRDEGGVKGRNNKGLVSFDRATKKDSFYVYKAFWSEEKFVHIAGERFVDRLIGKRTITVYSNLPSVKLIVNSIEYELQSDSKMFCFDVDIVAGSNLIKAIGDGCEHSITINGVEKQNEDYIMPEGCQGFIRNWFDEEGKNKKDYYSINDRVGKLWKSKEVQSMLKMAMGTKKLNPLLIALIKPFKVKTIIKIAGVDQSMVETANRYLQTIKKQ